MKKHRIKRSQFTKFLYKTSIELICIYRDEYPNMLRLFYRDRSNRIKCDIKISDALLIPEGTFHIMIMLDEEMVDVFVFHNPTYENLMLCHQILSVDSLFQVNALSMLKFIDPDDIERTLELITNHGLSIHPH